MPARSRWLRASSRISTLSTMPSFAAYYLSHRRAALCGLRIGNLLMSVEPLAKTLPSLIRTALAERRDEALVERVAGEWTPTSTARLLERVESVACAIRDAGVEAGDRVALIAHNCVDWVVCDFATIFAGCVVVPIYPTQALDHTAYIIEHSGVRLIFVDGPETWHACARRTWCCRASSF